jgi:hypothetical protein
MKAEGKKDECKNELWRRNVAYQYPDSTHTYSDAVDLNHLSTCAHTEERNS